MKDIDQEIIKFDYDGNYLKQKGMKEGASIGKTLKLIENEWINNCLLYTSPSPRDPE